MIGRRITTLVIVGSGCVFEPIDQTCDMNLLLEVGSQESLPVVSSQIVSAIFLLLHGSNKLRSSAIVPTRLQWICFTGDQ
mmetsp:Transcript_25929/g.55983  ORF Transcript_25929/g.55983 Transcript_25929/m.55983 type:complete len:80 (-) Transcript_25929:83-322(-)